MNTKTADSKGRIALGPQYANATFIIENVDETEIRIIAASVIPQRELWLHESKEAIEAVKRGIGQARARQFSKNPPKIPGNLKLTKEIEG